MVDMWPLRGYSVRYGLSILANSAFRPFVVSSSNPCKYMEYGSEDHKQQTRAAYG